MRDKRGYIFIDTIVAIVPFLLLTLAIVMLVNVISMQSKVQHALTKTAEFISITSYLDQQPADITDELGGFTSRFNTLFNISRPMPNNDIEQLLISSRRRQPEDIAEIFSYYLWIDERESGMQGLIGGYDGFDFEKSSISDGLVLLTVEYDIDFTFTGLFPPYKVTQRAATGMWDKGSK